MGGVLRPDRALRPPDEKGELALTVLNGAMEHYMFTGLDKHQRQAVIDQWRLLDVEAGHLLIQQGDIGESMFGACAASLVRLYFG